MTNLPDGLYRIENKKFCAGLIIKDGQVVQCAPILRRNLPYWLRTIANKLKEKEKEKENGSN